MIVQVDLIAIFICLNVGYRVDKCYLGSFRNDIFDNSLVIVERISSRVQIVDRIISVSRTAPAPVEVIVVAVLISVAYESVAAAVALS